MIPTYAGSIPATVANWMADEPLGYSHYLMKADFDEVCGALIKYRDGCGVQMRWDGMRDESEWVFPLMRSKVIYWVPIEERLPDEFETVLFMLEWDDTGRLEVCADTYHQMSLWVQGSIVAWAELLEPYKK